MSWSLIGRSGEMRAIQAAIAAPGVSGVVVSGPAGVGKSRIAREALSAAASHAYDVRWTVASSAAHTVPLGAFTTWARPDATDTVQLLRSVIESLTATPSGVTAVVGIDDVHLLDDLSTFVVHQIVQRDAAKVVLTVRDGEPVPAAVQEIWKEGRFDWLSLQPLTRDETTQLVSDTLGGPIDPDAAERLWTLTRGNVLYLRNIVDQEVTDGRIVQGRGCWRWIGDPVVPPSLAEMVESRIGALPARVVDVVDALAVGEPIDLAVLRRITDAEAVEEADIRGLITLEPVAGGVEVRVAHPLYGEVRRARSAPTRLRRLRGLVAAELAAGGDHDDMRVVVRRATLSLDSDLPPDADLLLTAARGAVWLADLALAERLAAEAIRAGAGPEASLVRAHALSWLGRGEEADAVFAAVPAHRLTDDDQARLAFLRASNMLWALGDPGRAKALIDDAAHTTASGARSYIDAFLTVYSFAMDQPDAALAASKNLALDELPAVVGAEVAWVLAVVFADAGRVMDTVTAADAGHDVATRSLDAPQMRFNIADAHVSALLLSGSLAEALELTERLRAEAADLPGVAQALGTAVAGRAQLGAGRLDRACALLQRAADTFAGSGHMTGWGYRYDIPRATALAIRGATGEAAGILAALGQRRRPFRSLDYELSLARAWVAAGEGAVSEGIAVLLNAAENACGKGQFAAEVLCLQTAAQFGERSVAARLGQLAALVEGPRAGVAARFARALHDRDAAALAAVSEEFEEMGDVVGAVDAAAHAAIVYRGQDMRGSALTCSARASALAENCGGASTPALHQAAERLPLTDREREIVMLIGEGLSNRAVAERLTLSVRTVESHIYQAMSKTGTNSRDQLAALLTRYRDRAE